MRAPRRRRERRRPKRRMRSWHNRRHADRSGAMAQGTQDKAPLVWIDMEMSGLVPDRDRILEVAMVVTDSELNVIAEAPVYVLHQSDAVLEAMDSWNKSTHG